MAAINGSHHTGKRQQRQQVGHSHQAVEEVGHGPDQIDLERGTDEDKHHHDNAVQRQQFFTKQCLEVGVPEEIPADDGGEREEEHADGDEDGAETAEGLAERRLGEGGTGEALGHQTGGDQHQTGEGKYHKGIDKDAQNGHSALILGLFHLGEGVGVGRGTKARLVGEEAAGNTEAHGLLYRDTGHTAGHRLGIKSQHKDLGKGGRQRLGVHNQDDDAAHNVKRRHDGDDFFGDRSDALHTAQEDEGRNGRHHDAHDQAVDAEGVIEGVEL